MLFRQLHLQQRQQLHQQQHRPQHQHPRQWCDAVSECSARFETWTRVRLCCRATPVPRTPHEISKVPMSMVAHSLENMCCSMVMAVRTWLDSMIPSPLQGSSRPLQSNVTLHSCIDTQS